MKKSLKPRWGILGAIAGPLVSLILAIGLTAIGTLTGITGAGAGVLSLIASINLALALFNLLPGLPLDGGNVLKALVWKMTGKPYKGIAFASKVGQFLGWSGIGLGVLSMLGISNIGSIWTLLVGWFLLQNADRYSQAARIQEQMSGLTAADAVIANSPIVSEELLLREFANNYIIGSTGDWKKYLVTNEAGHLVGEIPIDALKAVPTNDWWNIKVRELMQPAPALETVDFSQSLLEVVKLLEEKRIPALAVLKEGTLVGLLEKSSILKLLQKRAEAKLAGVN